MKVKKVLSGALAATMVLTAAPVTGINVLAATVDITQADHYTTEDPFVFPANIGDSQTLEIEKATRLLQDNTARWTMGVNPGTYNNESVTFVSNMNGSKSGGVYDDCAEYAYRAATAGLYKVELIYGCGGPNGLVISDGDSGTKIEKKTVKVDSTGSGAPLTSTTFMLGVNESGTGTMKITAAPDCNQAPRMDKMIITKVADKYTEENSFEFPATAGEEKKLEAEAGIITNTGADNEAYKAEVAAGTWASEGYFVNALDSGDQLKFYYTARAGIYKFKATYRSGSTSNAYTWAGDKIKSGSHTAGAETSNETHTEEFKVVVQEAGDGALTFTAPEAGSAQTDLFTVSLVVDKTDLLTVIEGAKEIDLTRYVDGTEKTAFSSALSAANTVATNYEDTLTQEEVDTAITNLNNAKGALIPIAVTGIKVTSQPAKKVYNVDDKFAATGLEVVAVKNDGTTEMLTTDQYSVTFDTAEKGPKEATVNATVDGNSYQCTIPNLVVVDGESLNSSVREATEKKDAHKYTSTTMTALEAALATAQTVQNDIEAANGDNSAEASGETVTSDRVDKAAAALQEAIDNLEQLYKISVPKPATISVKDETEYESGEDETTKWVYVPVATAVTVNAPKTADDKDFAGWVWSSNGKDNVISTSSTYTLYAVDDMVLTPSYNESADTSKEEIKLMCSTSWKSNKRSFTVKRSVPKNWTVVKHGVVITDEKGYNTYYSDNATEKKDFGIGTYRTKHTASKTTANNGTFVAKLTCAKKAGWYAKAYVQYKEEGFDNVITVWSGWIHE